MRMRALSSAPAAVRMRLHRKRRREGTHYVRIPLESLEIEGLIRLKVLPKAHRPPELVSHQLGEPIGDLVMAITKGAFRCGLTPSGSD
jgi:hypothetical protein